MMVQFEGKDVRCGVVLIVEGAGYGKCFDG